MKRKTFELLDEPRGDAYRTLLHLAPPYCDHFLLVVRRSIGLSEGGFSVLERLQPFLRSRSEESEWPGTKLTAGTADVFRYEFTRDATDILAEAADGLFSWRQPGLPEDPCLMRPDATPWLFSVVHEGEAFVTVDDQETETLKRSVPGLRLSLIRQN